MAVRNLVSALVARVRPVPVDPDFDPDFYRAQNPDLAHIADPRRLARHYYAFGKAEGRPAGPKILAEPEDDGVAGLPDDFDPKVYRRLHADLVVMSDAEAAEHYRLYGRGEGRAYRLLDTDLYRALYFPGQAVSDAALERHYEQKGRARGLIGSGAALMSARGLGGGAWVDRLKPDEFRLLNGGWAGAVSTKLDAVDRMLESGVERLAPIAFGLEFEPAYWRETHPDQAGSDAELYRRWLMEGLEEGEAGSTAQALDRLGLKLARFPEAFQWAAYASANALAADRWTALDHLVRKRATARAVGLASGPGAPAFLNALAELLAHQDDVNAIRFFTQARAQGSQDASALQHLGDCYFREGRWREALDAYTAVVPSPSAGIWTFANGARAALHLNRHDAAFSLLAQGRDRVVGDPEFRRALAECIESEFGRAGVQARELFASGHAETARALVARMTARAAERWTTLDPLGAPLPADPAGRVVMLANTDLRQCTHYRVEQKAQLLDALGIPYEIFSASEGIEPFLAALPGAAAAIFYRLPAFPQTVRAIQVATAMGVPTFYDIDDLLFDEDYPEPFATYADTTEEEYVWLQYGQPLFKAAMAMCDYGLASTTALARHMETVVSSGQVFVLPNGLDERNAGFLEQRPARARSGEDILVFYGSGTKAHNSDFMQLAGPALVAAFERHPTLKLMIVGHLSIDESLARFRDRIVAVDWTSSVQDYWSLLAEADINLAVLGRYPTTDAKSEIKWLEAAALGIPSLVSDTARYTEVLEDGVDALIAADAAEWADKLERLIADAPLRRRIGEAARAKAARDYALAPNAQRFRAALSSALDRPLGVAPRGERRRRVLLVNIFFPPQTLGGATRIIRDNIDYFLAHPDEHGCEFAVLTTDLGEQAPWRLRVEAYRGVPVFRLSTPYEANMEWRAYNGEIERVCAGLIAAWAPDLAHFHCVQRLTAAPLEACIRAGVPYLATIHDAWWIADYQFLADHRGRLVDPREPLPLNPPHTAGVGQALERRRRLKRDLDAAERVLVVSEAFARIYRDCGFPQSEVLSNGVPPLKAIPRRPSESGRVRLAHIGSQTMFKGYNLVEAAIRQSRLPNVELIVVEHTRYGGDERQEMWGETLVRFVGKTPQERMHELYAGIDVLLAPSLWPESYGLVSREALAAGLWVVASDRGAMGEDVTPGLNGWVIDVGSSEPLAAVLGTINADPTRYLRSPPAMPLRTGDDQARDVLRVYAETPDRPSRPPPPLPPPPAEPPARPPEPSWEFTTEAMAKQKALWRGTLRSRPRLPEGGEAGQPHQVR